MRIKRASEMDWVPVGLSHREGDIAFKVLLEGEEGSPENFDLRLAREDGNFSSPRHRHAWDQIRYCLTGRVPIGPKTWVEEGQIGYFPESVRYGPQVGGEDRIVLVLQFGGASGQGYLSERQIEDGRDALREIGAFEGGVFRRSDGTGPKNQDAYEAIWEHATGAEIQYAPPRYPSQILVTPDNFNWRDVGGGLRKKSLGAFSDRQMTLEMIEVAAGGETEFDAANGHQILFVTNGEGELEGEKFDPETAAHIETGSSATLKATSDTLLLSVTIPAV